MPEYFLILVLLLVVTVFLQTNYKVRIYKSRTHLLATNLILLVIAIIWDHVAISRGHWSFGQQFLLGPKIGLMPIEEYGFTLIVPYFGLVIFRILERQLGDK